MPTRKHPYAKSSTNTNTVDRVDAVRYGIQTLAPKFFSGAGPDFVTSGPNIGSKCHSNDAVPQYLHSIPLDNLGLAVFLSGTM